jgi:hypothetical protein
MQYCHAYLSAFPGEMGARVDKFELREVGDSKPSNTPPWGYSLARVTNKPTYGGTLKDGISRFTLKVVSPLRKYCSFNLGTWVIFLDYLPSCMKAQCCVKIGIKFRQLRTVMSTCVYSVLIQYVLQQTWESWVTTLGDWGAWLSVIPTLVALRLVLKRYATTVNRSRKLRSAFKILL